MQNGIEGVEGVVGVVGGTAGVVGVGILHFCILLGCRLIVVGVLVVVNVVVGVTTVLSGVAIAVVAGELRAIVALWLWLVSGVAEKFLWPYICCGDHDIVGGSGTCCMCPSIVGGGQAIVEGIVGMRVVVGVEIVAEDAAAGTVGGAEVGVGVVVVA